MTAVINSAVLERKLIVFDRFKLWDKYRIEILTLHSKIVEGFQSKLEIRL